MKIDEKIRISKAIIFKGITNFRSAIMWSGGKDSTAMLYMIMDVCDSNNIRVPDVIFIDHNQHFDEIVDIVERFVEDNGLYLVVSKNKGIIDGEPSHIDMNELERTGFNAKNLDLTLNSFEGNHLLKTMPMIRTIEERGYTGLFTGIRKDENPARSGEEWFSFRDNPRHARIHPMLHFSESDVWQYIHDNKINVPSLYEKGYRSIDGKTTSFRLSSDPAWLQDHKIPERAGRSTDKEQLMEKLRRWGYL